MIHSEKFNKEYFTSGAYENYQEFVAEWVAPMAKRIYQVLQNKSGAKILDVGCGFGGLIAELQNRYGFNVKGLEHSSYAMQKADSLVKKKIKKGNILKSPFKKDSFEAVICFDVICYFDRKEIDKVIKNLVDLSRTYIFFSSIYRHSQNASQTYNPDPLRLTVLSKKEYINLFSRNGAIFVKGFYEDNGGETLIFRKRKKIYS